VQHAGDWCDARAAEIVVERGRLAAALAALPNADVFASEANLLLVRFPRATEIWNGLAARGIVVRNLDPYTRITVGTPAENAMLLEALRELT
jgi:histidinol-phosphate aminotransferase